MGIRYNSFRTELDFRGLGQSASRQRNWTDPVVGARWVGQLRPSLALSARADLGGFGVGNAISRFTSDVELLGSGIRAFFDVELCLDQRLAPISGVHLV